MNSTYSISSPAFSSGENIPSKYTCDGEDVSPEFQWTDPPGGTESFVLICDDPDAPNGTWTHWVLFNIPADVRSLPEGKPGGTTLPQGTLSGENSWKRTGYGGPCPPSGTHRYFFKLFAVDKMLDVLAGATQREVELAMVGHVLGEAEVMGRYVRK